MSDEPSKSASVTVSREAPSVAELHTQQMKQVVQFALQGGVPLHYVNYFGLAQSPVDLSLVMVTSGRATGVITMPFGTAKSLLNNLQKFLDSYEKATGREIKAVEELQAESQKVVDILNA